MFEKSVVPVKPVPRFPGRGAGEEGRVGGLLTIKLVNEVF